MSFHAKFKKNISSFLKELHSFDYNLSYEDFIWNLIFPGKNGKWYRVNVTKYQKNYYISHIDGIYGTICVDKKSNIQVEDSLGSPVYGVSHEDLNKEWEGLIVFAKRWLQIVKKNWLVANKKAYEEYPLNRRFGIVPHSLIKESLKDIYDLRKETGEARTKKFISIVEEGYFCSEKNMISEFMTANDYFDYCKIAYTAGRRRDESFDKNLSGLEMYKRYADGRHNGLLDIKFDSRQEFSDWIDGKHPKRSTGGHPWEIKRGGNTTHIDLSVFRPEYQKEKGFKIELRASALHRLRETINMFLALHKASKPISIANPEGIRKRLLGQDNIGIIPSYMSLHRANEHFREDQAVYDVLYYDDIGRYKRRLTPFIIWEPLPILKPKG